MEMDMPDLDSSIFKINHPTGLPEPGSLLVAEPFLKEDHFNHAVILLVEHAAGKSAMGLVLNKPTGYTMGEAIEGVDESVELPIYCGGPMSCDRLFYLHCLPGEFEGSRPIAGDLYIGGDFEQVKRYLNMGLPTHGLMRFFIGYSGWEPRQLETEIRDHVWAVAPQPCDNAVLLDAGDPFWHQTVRSMGEPYRNWLYHPLNPQYN